jgi:hypothetical protein
LGIVNTHRAWPACSTTSSWRKAHGPGVVPFRGGSYSDEERLNRLDRVVALGGDLERSITVVDGTRIYGASQSRA